MSPSTTRDQSLFKLVSFGRRGPGRTDRLSSGQIAEIARIVERAPEVMVKVSGGGTSPKAVTAHFKYLSRCHDFEIETDEGERLRGGGPIRALIDDWDLDLDAEESLSPYRSAPGPKPSKLVHNIVLSMPKHTPPTKLLEASRAFAREQFALKHRYAMVLHTDKDHPHVHLVVKARSEAGQRLNIRKATLREWRREFARHLREHGIEANATERAIRGITVPRKLDGIYRAHQEGRSIHMQRRAHSAGTVTSGDKRSAQFAQADLIRTRRRIELGWHAVSRSLQAQGQLDLATHVQRFLSEMPLPQTEGEWIVAQSARQTLASRAEERGTPR